MARRRSLFTVINEGSSVQYLRLQLALSASLPVADRLSYYAINLTKNETVYMCSAGGHCVVSKLHSGQRRTTFLTGQRANALLPAILDDGI